MNCNTYFDKKIEIKEAICLMETKINELVEMYNRVDADHKIIAEKVKELEKLIDYLLGAGLAEEVKKKLEEWLADGTLANIIGDTLNKWTARITKLETDVTSINSQLDNISIKTDMLNSYYSRLNRGYISEVARKIRYGNNIKITFYGDSNTVRSNNLFQNSFVNFLNLSTKGTVSFNNRGFSGDTAQMGYDRWNTNHDGDISVIIYGTNDSAYINSSEKMKEYINSIEKLIVREIEWGKAVVLISPIPCRDDLRFETPTKQVWTNPWSEFRADVQTMSDVYSWIANKYSCPFVNSEFLADYEDSMFAGVGTSLIMEDNVSSQTKDPVHLIDGYLKIWAIRSSSIFLGDNLLNVKNVSNGTQLTTRYGIDGYTTKIDFLTLSDKRIVYDNIYKSFALANNNYNRAIKMSLGDVLTYSFYCDQEGLTVYPVVNAKINSAVRVSLDNDSVQPSTQLNLLNEVWTEGRYPKYIDINADSTKEIVNKPNTIGNYSDSIISNKGLFITTKGWHTIKITCTNGTCLLSGLDFRKENIDDIMKQLNMTLQNNWEQYENWSTPQYSKKDNRVYLKGCVKGGTIGKTISTLPVEYRPKNAQTFAVVTSNDNTTTMELGIINIFSNGMIAPIKGYSGFISLDGISFTID